MTLLNVLLVEDNESDALLILHTLRRGGFEVSHVRVETAESFSQHLQARPWDIILSDYNLPTFNGLEALKILQETGQDIPFILISGAIGEETAVTALKAGAHDYLLKDRLSRLGPAVSRELAEAQRRSELRKAQIDLAEAHRLADLANQRKSQVLAFVAHEFKNPLVAVMCYGDMLERGMAGELTEKQRDYVHNMSLGAQQLQSLVDDILDIATIEAGKLSLEPELIDLSSLLQEIQVVIDAIARRKNLTLTIHCDELIQLIHADRKRMRQILINLLSNAVKYTPENGQVSLTMRQVEGDEKSIAFDVRDNGIGMSPAELSYLFTEFYRVDNRLTSNKEGVGLGLALTKRLVELHNGAIDVESVPGEGSCFTVRIPCLVQTSQAYLTEEAASLKEAASF